MKKTEPLRTKKEINDLLRYLKAWNANYYIGAMILLQWGLRVSDALALTVGSVIVGDGKRVRIQRNIFITEQKTGHKRYIAVSAKMANNLARHIRRTARSENGEIDTSQPLICSRKHTEDGGKKAMSRRHMGRVIDQACKAVGIKGSIGAHGLRKTFAFQAWESGARVDVLQKVFGHSSPSITHIYACIPSENEREVYESIDFGFLM